MDAEDVFAILFLLTILTLPLTLGLLVTSLVAYSRTKKHFASRRRPGSTSSASRTSAGRIDGSLASASVSAVALRRK